ncbi:hypothetical protein DYB25_001677 [Aphanomyces astaci]|uniref:Uncharacterized protein n=1 Tax=Aphanomyces astaci TaxID=112090 RepID=A0A397BDQ4_APHAT|nr:hypothetical protein DYB25_001677 [Aphanomyces astaci]
MSSACARGGDWWYPTNATTQFITSYHRAYFPLPCTNSACRQDMDTAVAALKAVNCDEAQASASAMAGVVRLCQSLSLAPKFPRCSPKQIATEVAYPAACKNIIRTSIQSIDELLGVGLNEFDGICQAPGCVEALRTAVATLPDCQVEYPREYKAGAPMSKKQVYLSYLSSFCDPTSSTAKDFTSCDAKLAALYAAPFSDECNTALVGNMFFSPSRQTHYILFRALYDMYPYTTKVIASIPSCAADLAAVISQTNGIGACAANISLAFQVLALAHSTTFTPAASSSVPICDKAQEFQLITSLHAAPPTVCTQVSPSSTAWFDVLMAPLPEMSAIAASPPCVAAAVAWAASSFPSCDMSYVAYGDIPTGIPVATRITRYLQAAQSLFNASTTPTKTSAAVSTIFDGGYAIYCRVLVLCLVAASSWT